MLTAKELLKTFATCELAEELAKREGVKEIVIPNPDSEYDISYCISKDISNRTQVGVTSDSGPATILIITD